MLSMVKEGSCGGSLLGLWGIKLSLEKKGPRGPFNDLAFTRRKKKWRSVAKDEGEGRIQS